MIVIIIAAIAVVLGLITHLLSKYLSYDLLALFASIITITISLVDLILIICVFFTWITLDGARAANMQCYKSLKYKAETETIRDEFGIVNKEYIDEVQEWNQKIAKYRMYSESKWIGVFYPASAIHGCEIIDLNQIRIKRSE